jgi:hypothetical protein
MKLFLLSLFFLININANDNIIQDFYAKAVPIEHYIVKSIVNGEVIYVNRSIESNSSNNTTIIEIDTKVDTLELKQLNQKLNIINKMIKIEKNNQRSINKISSKSKFEKDNQKLKVLNIQSNKIDLIIKINRLKDIILHKTIIDKSNYIDEIFVQEGDFFTTGTKLYSAYDLTNAKLEIFVSINNIEKIRNKTIYLNNIKTSYKINKIFKVANQTHLSSYKCKIIINKPNQFSKLVKIEFK